MTIGQPGAEREYGGPPTLDLEVGRLDDDQFYDRLGYVIGRQFLWLAIGIPLTAFTGGGFAVAGYLMTVIGFLLIGVAVITALLMRYGRPYRGWRLGAAALAVSVVPVVCLWPAGPGQHVAGLRLPVWLDALATVLAVMLAFVLVDRRSRGVAVFRLAPPPGGDAASLAWLDERVAYLESLLHARRVWSPERRDVIRALGNARLTRFQHAAGGQVADLHLAVDFFRQAAAETPPGARDEPGVYHDLASVLGFRAMLEMRGEDFEEALALLRGISSSELGRRLPERERDWVERWMYELIWVRVLLHRQLQLPAGDEAVRQEALRELAAMASQERPDFTRARILLTIAEFHLLWTYEETRGPLTGVAEIVGHLDQAIDAVRSAEALLKPDDQDKQYAQSALAHLLARRVRLRALGLVPANGADADHEQAKRYLRLVMADPAITRPQPVAEISGSLAKVLDTASLCIDVELSHGRWQEAAEIGRSALAILEAFVGLAIFRRIREDALRLGRGLHGKLGYAIAMANAGQPHAMLEVIRLIESGRAVLLREALGRSELSEQADRLAAAGHAVLAAEITATLSRIAQLEAIEFSAHDTEGRAVRRRVDDAGHPLRDSIGKAHRDIAGLRTRIDAVLGADHGQATYRDLASATAAPLCYILHVSRGDDGAGPDLPALAFVVSPSPASSSSQSEEAVSVRAVSLPGVTSATIRDWHDRWQGSYARETLRTGELVMLGELFQELGEKLVEPVFEAAGRPARLVLLPDGMLSMLPLHAAAVRDEAGLARPLCQHAVATYAPTAAVLRSCQVRAAAIDKSCDGRLPSRFVGIAAADAELRGSSPELRSAAAHFEITETIGDDATPPQVLAALAANARAGGPSVLHFACHARAEISDPLSSFFQLAPGPEGQVRLADLLAVGLGTTRTAVLSACETGMLGSADPDQYVSLATGFVQIGAAGVVGTLARVADPVALALTRRLYEAWAQRPADPAMALSIAQRWLATASPAILAATLEDAYPGLERMDIARFTHPAHWAPFFFIGA